MEWFSLGVELIKALAWPLAFLIIMFSFRGEIRGLVALVSKLKAGPLEFEFEKKLESAKAVLADSEEASSRTLMAERGEDLDELASIYPGAAIIETWQKVETELYRLAKEAGVEAPKGGVAIIMDKLERAKVIDEATLSVLKDLRTLRNQVAHRAASGFEPTTSQALDYSGVANAVLQRLTIKKRLD